MSVTVRSRATGRKPAGGSSAKTFAATVARETPADTRSRTWSWNCRKRASPSAVRWSATMALQLAAETSGRVTRRLTDQLSMNVIVPACQ